MHEPKLVYERPVDVAARIMLRFAERTGLRSTLPERRYLWTDAFAVCNFLGLARVLGTPHGELALDLVQRVHHVLGRHRADDPRSGRLSGLDEAEGELHPTRGGLRIGKELPERLPGEELDAGLEWERDGQYFHYITQWMHALDQVSRATGQPKFNAWARELAEVAHHAFTVRPERSSRKRMFWKMSIDLSRPLVPSMGQHDPLSGYVGCLELQVTRARLGATSPPDLEGETADFLSMLSEQDPSTDDPLGLGGLLSDAYRLDQLARQGAEPDPDLALTLLASALTGLDDYTRSGALAAPAERRLAFRELGLAIGLAAVESMIDKRISAPTRQERALLSSFRAPARLRKEIVDFWLDPVHRQVPSWAGHRDINEVMLATALAPEGFLELRPASRAPG